MELRLTETDMEILGTGVGSMTLKIFGNPLSPLVEQDIETKQREKVAPAPSPCCEETGSQK